MSNKQKKDVCTPAAVSALEHESLFDEALGMARDLSEIEKEVRCCALCDGREDCGYSSRQLLEKLSYILFKSVGYHRQDKYSTAQAAKASGSGIFGQK